MPASGDSPDRSTRNTGFRTGIGYDSHRFADEGRMLLGGVEVAEHIHLAGHSDGDAVAHALTDAVLGAAAAGDIGEMFPDTDPANRDRDSMEYVNFQLTREQLIHAAAEWEAEIALFPDQ